MEPIRLERITKTFTTHSTDVVIKGTQRPAVTRTVLRELNMEIPVGKLTVIVGRSGCGKSTLLRLINGDVKQDSGEIHLPHGFRSSLLSADPYVITWTSVLRNIAMAAGAGQTPEERIEQAEKLLRLVRLEKYSDLTPAELSTGMRQRLGLARVLASRSQILLMDEPFASLDFITREELQKELLAIQAKDPRTILLVTHQLEEALLMAEYIVVMHEDSSIEHFDLTHLAYPRDLLCEELLALRAAVTEACRR